MPLGRLVTLQGLTRESPQEMPLRTAWTAAWMRLSRCSFDRMPKELPAFFSQAKDVAADHPDKVQELKDLFWEEAERYKVLPLLGAL